MVEQEEADFFATVECFAEWCLFAQQDVGEIDGDSGDHRQTALWCVGDTGKRIDRRHLDRQIEPTDPGDLGGEHQQIGWLGQRRQRPGEQQREREAAWRIGVGIVLLDDLVLETQQRPWINLERKVEVDWTVARLFRVEVDLPQLPKRVCLDEMAFVVHVESVIDGVALQLGDESGDINDGHDRRHYRERR